jgi:hypothetical protein
MKQDFNWGTTILIAAVAAVGISSQHSNNKGRETGPPVEISKQSSSAGTQTAKLLARGPCVDIEEHLQEFLLGASRKSIAAPSSCYPSSALPKDDSAVGADLRKNAQHLHFMIAILPDPLHTHFSLSFDRLTEAIQQGASDEKYVYDSSWLPWETEEAKLALIKDQDEIDERKKAREEQPGILLFRKDIAQKTNKTAQPYDDGLVVFIVAEEPTQGIHRIQFENATAWIAALEPRTKSPPPPYKLPGQILGPSFSGSIPSLANLLVNVPTGQGSGTSLNPPKTEVSIYSGSVTSSRAATWLVASTSKHLNVHFASFQQSDDLVLARYCRYLQQSHFELRKLAIISEDETAYGGEYSQASDPSKGSSLPCDMASGGPAQLYYPRDISALRTAYQKESIFSSSSSQPSTDAPRRTLTTDIADPEGKEHDTIRDYSGNQTALSQEAVLQQIVSMLRVHQSEYLLLRSSNPLDQLFLSHYLRIAYPQGRIVVLGADLLLRRESGAARLSGIMTLDTYPLLPWEPHWTRVKGTTSLHSHRVYSQDATEGTYIATRFLIHEPRLKPSSANGFLPTDPNLQIPDYSVPFWLDEQISAQGAPPPPTWLSVLGRDNFWPLAAIDETSLPESVHSNPSLIQRIEDLSVNTNNAVVSMWRIVTFWRGNTTYENLTGGMWYPWPAMPLSMKIAFSILFFSEIFHWVCCYSPSVTIKPSHRAYFVCIPESCRSHVTLLVLASLLFSAMVTLLAWGSGVMAPDGEPLPHPRLNMGFLLLMWLIAGSSLAINILKQPKKTIAISKEREITEERSPHWSPQWNTVKQNWLSIREPLLAFVAGTVIVYFLVYFSLELALNHANRIPTYWRSMNLSSGVSPLVPLIALTAGAYMWVWYSLQGLAFFGPDRPLLPSEKTLEFTIEKKQHLNWLRMFSRELAGCPVEAQCWPFARPTFRIATILFLVLASLAIVFAVDVPIRSLGARRYSIFVCLFIDACASLMLANAWQLLHVWLSLRQLLTFLNRLKLRRSMATFLEITWGSVWKISGNVFEMRYKLLVNQLDCVTHLQNSIKKVSPSHCDYLNLDRCKDSFCRLNEARTSFAEWYSKIWNHPNVCDQSKLKALQACLAETAGNLLAFVLIPAWRREDGPLFYRAASEDDGKAEEISAAAAHLEPHIRFAEQLVCFVYLGFIQNILGRMRSLVMGILWMFVAATVSMASYPFDPRPVISAAMVVLFLALGTIIVFVYAQMHRDPILSLVTNTKPGELGADFWLKLAGFGAGPVLGLVATLFPEVTDFLFSWIQPGMSSIK